MFPKPTTYRSRPYLDFVKTLACAIEGRHVCEGDIVAHHTSCGGKSLKGPDLHSIPLCHKAHNEHDHLGKDSFYERYNIDRWEVVAKTLAAYVETLEKKEPENRFERVCREWLKGCSCSEERSPELCDECTGALLQHLKTLEGKDGR